MKKEEIIVGRGEKGVLADMYTVCYRTVTKALRGYDASYVAKRIRKTALDRGGVYKSQIPNC